MPARYMLDTDICIFIRRRRPRMVHERFSVLASGDVVMSVVTYGELRFGALNGPHRERDVGLLEAFVASVPVQHLHPAVGTAYGDIRACLSKRGEQIGPNDLWIAAHARTSDLTLVTNNEREFRRVPGLKVENWAVA